MYYLIDDVGNWLAIWKKNKDRFILFSPESDLKVKIQTIKILEKSNGRIFYKEKVL